MGAGRSRHVEAVMEVISKVCIDSASVCLSAAENKILIEVAEVQGNVIISDVVINSIADATVQCTNNDTIDLGSLTENLTTELNSMIEQANVGTTQWRRGHEKIRLVNDIVTAMEKRQVSMCVSQAINEFKISVESVGGDFKWMNYDIMQLASANMKRCLNEATFKVGNVPLRKYLEENLPNFKVKLPPQCEAIAVEAENMRLYGYGAIGGSLGISLIMIVVYSLLLKPN